MLYLDNFRIIDDEPWKAEAIIAMQSNCMAIEGYYEDGVVDLVEGWIIDCLLFFNFF